MVLCLSAAISALPTSKIQDEKPEPKLELGLGLGPKPELGLGPDVDGNDLSYARSYRRYFGRGESKAAPGAKVFRLPLSKLSFFFLFFVFCFLLNFGLSRFIQYHIAGFDEPTIPQSPPSHLLDYSTCNNARLEFSTVPSFDPNDWCLKNGLHSGGLNPGPLGHESSALTTRPGLLALS
jgi:hypothetical protein